MAEWSNGGNGYIRTIYGTHTHTDDIDDDDNDTLIFYSIEGYMLLLYRTQGLRFDHSLQRKNYGNKICMVASSLAGI